MTDQDIPSKIQVSFHVMAYCQSVQSPSVKGEIHHRRDLTNQEKGMLLAAQNLVRNWLNGELEFQSPLMPEGARMNLGDADGFTADIARFVTQDKVMDDDRDSCTDDEDGSS